MDWPYLHTLVNHFPIILTVVGAAVLALAYIVKRRGVWVYAVATLTLSGLSVYPAYFSGDEASHALRGTWYVVRSSIAAHDDSAGYALVALLLMGAAAAAAWWYLVRHQSEAHPPKWLQITLAVVTVLGVATMVRTAYLGGKIIHESPLLKNPPAGVTADTSATR